jgi:hypothetical protein
MPSRQPFRHPGGGGPGQQLTVLSADQQDRRPDPADGLGYPAAFAAAGTLALAAAVLVPLAAERRLRPAAVRGDAAADAAVPGDAVR